MFWLATIDWKVYSRIVPNRRHVSVRVFVQILGAYMHISNWRIPLFSKFKLSGDVNVATVHTSATAKSCFISVVGEVIHASCWIISQIYDIKYVSIAHHVGNTVRIENECMIPAVVPVTVSIQFLHVYISLGRMALQHRIRILEYLYFVRICCGTWTVCSSKPGQTWFQFTNKLFKVTKWKNSEWFKCLAILM